MVVLRVHCTVQYQRAILLLSGKTVASAGGAHIPSAGGLPSACFCFHVSLFWPVEHSRALTFHYTVIGGTIQSYSTLPYTAHVKVPFVGFNVHIVERTLNTHKRAKYGGYETHLFSLRPNAMSAEGQRYDFRQRTRRRTKTLIKEYRRCGVVPP